jgi:hypothetical protein
MVSVATMPSCHDVREAPCACVCACDLIHPRTSSLWHVHMMRPALYLAGCSSLLGYTGVIDHDPGYVSPKKVACSDVAAKLSRLYRRERQFSFLPPLGVADLGDDTQGFVLMKSTDDWHVALAASNTLSHRPTRRLCQEPIQRSCYTPWPHRLWLCADCWVRAGCTQARGRLRAGGVPRRDGVRLMRS